MGERRYHIMELITLDGAGSVTEIIGDYSITPGSFRYVSGYNSTKIERMIVSVVDSTVSNTADYGNISGLTNGIQLYHRDSEDNILETLTPFPVKTNQDWSAVCYDVTYHTLGAGSDQVSIRWTFSKTGLPIELKIGEYLEVSVNDDFTD